MTFRALPQQALDCTSHVSFLPECCSPLVNCSLRSAKLRCREEKEAGRKKKLYDPDEEQGERWAHDRFELLDQPPEMDDYRVSLIDTSNS